MAERAVGSDGARVLGHDLTELGLRRVAAFGDDAEQCVALGKDARETPALDDKNRADALRFHETRGRRDGHVGGCGDGSLILDDAAHGTVHGLLLLTLTLLRPDQLFFCGAAAVAKMSPCEPRK